MSALVGDVRELRLWIVAGVSLVHAALIAALLLIPIPVVRHTAVTIVDIEFAEIEQELPPLAPPPLPVVPNRLPELAQRPKPLSAPEPPPASGTSANPLSSQSLEPAASSVEVLTQLEPAAAPASAATRLAANDGDQDKVARTLRLLSCQKLSRDPDETCPKRDPFEVAEALAARELATHNPTAISVFDQQNAAERFFSRQSQDRHMFPGMDADLFADPAPPGANDAERIRNGGSPNWSEEMKRGFTKDD